jgi:crotonobetaine/carnitine-CoA ligase
VIDEAAMTEPRTFASELAARVEEHPDKVFLHLGDESLTFGEAQRAVRSAGNQLLELGVAPGETVALLTLACREWIATWLACAEVGAISMPINVMFRGEFLRHQLADSAARVLLVDAMFLPQVAEVLADTPDLHTLVVRGDVPADVHLPEGVRVVDSAILGQGATDAVLGGRPHAWNEVACLFYTSGTTGPSKGALLTQQYLCVAAAVLADAYGMTADDVMYAAVPLFHLGGAYGVVAGALVSGRTAVLDPAFSVSACWDRVREHGATIFLGVGPMIAMLMSLPPDPRDAELPIRLLVGAPVPPGMHEAVEARYGCAVMQAYGQTEVIPVAMSHAGSDEAPGSAGRLGPLHEVRIVDDEDRDVAPGAPGEIVVRPRYPHVMFEGYRNQPEATLAQLGNLWYHTGDLGRIDEGGNLWWVDRKKDAIRRRGENISSFEVEQAVLLHPAVAEAAVHGVPSPIGEDDVKVCVVLVAGADLSPKELMDHCVEHMPSFMVPRYVDVRDALPKNVIGRVQKHVLRERPLGPTTWDREAEGYVVGR